MELPLKASDDKNQIKASNAKRRVAVLFWVGFFFVFFVVFLQYDLRPISMTRSSRSGLWFSILYFVLIFSCGRRTYTASHVWVSISRLIFFPLFFIWRLLNKRIKPKTGAFNCEIIERCEPFN